MIADETGADLFEVLPADDHYPFTYAEIMYTVFENNDFSEKTLIPFSTHEGSGQRKGICKCMDIRARIFLR